MKNIIYGLVHPETQEVRYIGRSNNGLSRPLKHMMKSSYENPQRRHFPVYCWIRSLLKKGLEPCIVILETVEKESSLNSVEVELIAKHRLAGMRLLNCTAGGGGQLGRVVSEETKEKLRRHNLGKKQSQETIDKRMKTFEDRGVLEAASKRMKGQKRDPAEVERRAKKMRGTKRGPRSEETKEKLRQANLGKKQSADSIEKMLQTREIREWNSPMQDETVKKKHLESRIRNDSRIRSVQDQFGEVYRTLVEASRSTGISIGGITYSLKREKYIKGYLFRYVEEQKK